MKKIFFILCVLMFCVVSSKTLADRTITQVFHINAVVCKELKNEYKLTVPKEYFNDLRDLSTKSDESILIITWGHNYEDHEARIFVTCDPNEVKIEKKGKSTVIMVHNNPTNLDDPTNLK